MAWIDFLRPGAMLLAGGFDMFDRNNRRRQMDRDMRRRQALEEAHYNARLGQGGGSGGGGRNTGAAMNALREQNALAMAMLQPYVDQANKTLPIMSEAYHGGLQGMTPVIGNVLSQDFINPLTQVRNPTPPPLPEFLAGGRRE